MSDRLNDLYELERRIARGRGYRPRLLPGEIPQVPEHIRTEWASMPDAPECRGTTVKRDDETSVYRLYDSDDKILYVGLSMSVAERLGQHRQSGWWNKVSRIEIDRLPTRDAASARERELIADLRPPHNRNGGGA